MVNMGSGQCCIICTQFLPSDLCELLQHNQELPQALQKGSRRRKVLPKKFTSANLELILKTSKGV